MKAVMPTIIAGRLKELLALVREAVQVNLIERELALLAIDLILALKKDKGLAKVGCQCFLKIDFAISGALRKKLSQETRDLMNEMIILDELGDTYGPDLNRAVNAAKKILEKQNGKLISDARELARVVGSRA